jgi:hypothetical protein
MAGMSKKEITRLLDHIEPQGVQLTRTKKGMMLRLPDGTSTMIHFTGSDVRERDNVRARLKRAGVEWPGEGSPLGAAITDTKPWATTLEYGAELLAGWDQKYINGSQLRRLSQAAGRDMNNQTAQRILYHLGWLPTGKSTARKWLRPLDQLEDIYQLELESDAGLAGELEGDTAPELEAESPTEAPAAPEAVPAPTEPESAPSEPTEPPAREFIDTAESWAIDPDQISAFTSWAEIQRMLRMMGLQGELRVWRAERG